MKKATSLLLALAMTGTLLAGCGSALASVPDPVAINSVFRSA